MGNIESVPELFVLLVIAALSIAAYAGWMTWLKRRVKSYVEFVVGGKLLSSTWEPFARGWFWEKYTVYLVEYKDRRGDVHRAYAKVTPFGNVHLADDSVIERQK